MDFAELVKGLQAFAITASVVGAKDPGYMDAIGEAHRL